MNDEAARSGRFFLVDHDDEGDDGDDPRDDGQERRRTVKMKAVLPLLVLTMVSMLACGDNNEDDDVPEAVTTFSCLTETCDTEKGEFCLFEKFAENEVEHSPVCLQPENACTGCECARDAVDDYFDGANNCSGIFVCRQDNDAIVVECQNPRL